MSYLLFLAALLLAAIVAGALRLFGFRPRYGKIFEAIAIAASFLPILLMHSLIVFIVGFGLLMAVVGVLEATGLVQSFHVPNVPDRYIVFGLAFLAIVYSISSLLVNFARWGRGDD
jgi:hypothetical protein